MTLQPKLGTIRLRAQPDGADGVSLVSTGVNEGTVAVLTFLPKGEFEDARFEVAGGIVFDPSGMSNALLSGEALSVQMVPSVFALSQNYPNPFNPETTIEFALPALTSVELSVYDARGKRVATLVRGDRKEGLYREVWDGRDDRGNLVGTGVYFCRLNVDGRVFTRKMVFLK